VVIISSFDFKATGLIEAYRIRIVCLDIEHDAFLGFCANGPNSFAIHLLMDSTFPESVARMEMIAFRI